MSGIEMSTIWESNREWIVVDRETHEEQILLDYRLDQLGFDLTNLENIKGQPSPMSVNFDEIYNDLQKGKCFYGISYNL